MNLDDRIRSSARSQSDRYRGADDLFTRIEHRRRQRAARRVSASAAAVVVVFGGAALTLANLRDNGGDTDVASATELTVADTLQPPTTPVTTPPPVTASTTTPISTTTTDVPSETSPVQVPVATTAADANVPSPSILPDGTTGINEFWNVPQFGTEPVRGSGCGSSGQLGDIIPDGLWAGYLAGDGNDGDVDIDVACVYLPDAAAAVLANANATIVNDDPNYLIVNNNTRTRTMPLDRDLVLRIAERDAAGRCLDSRATTNWTDIPADRQVWVRIHAGRVTWILAGCAD